MTITHQHSERAQFTATVAASQPLCQEHWRLTLRLDQFPSTRAGQFVQVACRDTAVAGDMLVEHDWQSEHPIAIQGRELAGPMALLRRPFSLGGRRDLPDGVELTLIHRVVGVGTRWLSELKQGDQVSIIGPLGNGFVHPPAGGVAILVGGGVGIPPMLYLASELAGRKAVAFCGALRRELLPLTITADAKRPAGDAVDPLYNIAEFAGHGVPAVVTTDDGSWGYRGLVTEALERYLDRYFAQPDQRQLTTVYTCGPEGMMKRVAAMATERGIACQVAVERAMACGMGTCQSCVIRVKDGQADSGWVYKLACRDGPVFRGEELMW